MDTMKWLMTAMIITAFGSVSPTLVLAEGLEEVEAVVDTQSMSGEADPEVAETILEVINDPENEGSAEEEAELRDSIVDMADSFSGSEMTPEAAETLKNVTAEP